ncbi:MAG: cation transporter [Proteobacteria bacterium]|nr:cation transporter [Pseudomonadota bacterium]
MDRMIEQKSADGEVRQVQKITFIGILINIGLSGLKFVVGYLGSSQAVIADAVHSLSDVSTDFMVIVGVKFWSAPPDEDHPYGHRKVEAMISSLIGAALVAVALGLAFNSLSTVRAPHIGQTTWVAIIGPLLSIVLKEFLYRWTMKVGKRVKSSAVVANAWHQRSDALSSIPAVLAVAVSALYPDWAFVDHIGALIISLFILKVAWDIIWPALSELTDRGASENDQRLLEELAITVPGVKEIHALRTRKIGSNHMVDLHVLVDPEISVRAGHKISERVKEELIDKGPNVLDVVVHLEPWEISFASSSIRPR